VRLQEERIWSRHNIAFEYNRRLISISYLHRTPVTFDPFEQTASTYADTRSFKKYRLSCLPSKLLAFAPGEIVSSSFLLDQRELELTNEYLKRAELSQTSIQIAYRTFFLTVSFSSQYKLNLSAAKILWNVVVSRITTSFNLFKLYISM